MKTEKENTMLLDLAIKAIDSVVAEFKGNRQERYALEMAFQKVSEKAKANEVIIVDLNKTILDQSNLLNEGAKKISELETLLANKNK